MIVDLEIESAVTQAECERLAEVAAGRTVLEIGSFFGRSTVALASTARVVHAVDPHPLDADTHVNAVGVSTLDALRLNLQRHRLQEKTIIHIAWSPDLLPVFRPVFDLVFIDADHEREPVDRDIALAMGCLRPEGVLAFHDYGVPGTDTPRGWVPFGVTDAVDEVVRRSGARLEVVNTLAVVSFNPPM